MFWSYDEMTSKHRGSRGRAFAALLYAGLALQLGGCNFGEITTTTTLDGRQLIESLLRGVILTPLDQFITDSVNDLFADEP